jgi:hypothetical protein
MGATPDLEEAAWRILEYPLEQVVRNACRRRLLAALTGETVRDIALFEVAHKRYARRYDFPLNKG